MKALYSHYRPFELALVHHFYSNRTIIDLLKKSTFTALSDISRVVTAHTVQIGSQQVEHVNSIVSTVAVIYIRTF